MSFKRIISLILLLTVVFFGLFSAYAAYKYFTEKPPVEEINLARESIAKAKSVHAGKYASERLKEAEKLFKEAMAEWTVQNDKMFVFRDYSRVKELATGSLNISNNAKSEAGSAKDKYEKQLEKELNEIENLISRFETYYKNLPVGRINFDRYNEGKIKYFEAVHESKMKDLHKAMILAKRANEKLEQAEKASHARLENFYKDFPDWQKNAKQAVQLSKKGQTVILINKMESTCAVLKSGKVTKTFDAEFGPNWMGDKIMRGDRTTPQGVYKVTEKKRGSKTIYYKALLLNYPNGEDNTRFNRLKKSGSIPRSANIGGLIEIHGGGGKGVNWTDGCIALKNEDMDVVYDMCSVSTPVIIIGADKSLNEYLSGVK